MQEPHSVFGLIFACTCGVVLGVGFCANLLAFSLFAQRGRLRRSRLDVLLLSMALADSLTLLLVPFTLHSAVSFSWPLGNTSCKVYQVLLALSLGASTYSLCAVSAARAMVVTNPYRPPSRDVLLAMFAAAWASSFFISVPLRIFASEEAGHAPGLSFCLPTVQEHHYQVVLTQFVLYYLLPMLVIAVNYSRLGLVLRRAPVLSLAGLRNTRRASLTVFLASATFSACWLPGYVLELCVYLGLYRHGHAWETFYFICTLLQHLHPCLNPLLYVLLARRHRTPCLPRCPRARVHPQISSVAPSF
ncbi:galanin receptor 2a [Conger conger]|uniref:galanin receptor 2a n=1 Tax=Conger conger TaxID=82655 RepID=UPI002A5A93B4|nr:galanin receptor 2a [Conger conger]